MSTLLVSDWIEKSGGAEKVIDAMVHAFPDSQIRTLWNDAPERYSIPVTETWLAHTPIRRAKSLAVPLATMVWPRQRAPISPERILISSHLFAHHARFPQLPDVPRYAYVHTPARYIWTPELDPRSNNSLVKLTSPLFRRIDRSRAQLTTAVAANSNFVRERIAKAWHRDATVIYPPVDVTEISAVEDWRNALSPRDAATLADLPKEFILGASRLVSYKGLDQVLNFAAAVGLPAVIGGEGPERQRLETQAQALGVPVHLLGRTSTPLLLTLYQQAVAYVFPPIEDFGIMPVEAMAAGARVIVNAVGGAAESVQHGASGIHAPTFQGSDAREALEKAASIDRSIARARAKVFSKEHFVEKLIAWAR